MTLRREERLEAPLIIQYPFPGSGIVCPQAGRRQPHDGLQPMRAGECDVWSAEHVPVTLAALGLDLQATVLLRRVHSRTLETIQVQPNVQMHFTLGPLIPRRMSFTHGATRWHCVTIATYCGHAEESTHTLLFRSASVIQKSAAIHSGNQWQPAGRVAQQSFMTWEAVFDSTYK